MNSTDRKIDEIQKKILRINVECQKHQKTIEKEKVKDDMLSLLNATKHYNAAYYYRQNTKDLTEIEALRSLNRRIKFPEIEDLIDRLLKQINFYKADIKKLEIDNGLLAKIFRKFTQEEILKKRKKLHALEE